MALAIIANDFVSALSNAAFTLPSMADHEAHGMTVVRTLSLIKRRLVCPVLSTASLYAVSRHACDSPSATACQTEETLKQAAS